MVLAPLLAFNRRWTSRFPRTGIAVWLGALGSGTVALVAGVGVAIHAARVHAAEADRSLSSGSIVNGLTLTLLTCLMMSLVGGIIGTALYRAGLNAVQRRRLRRLVEMATPSTARQITVIESSEPSAVSMGGRNPRIMISSCLQDQLSSRELTAVVEHERAHLSQRHHALLHIADLQYRCAPVLPCARALDQSLRLLVELAADDHAARRCGVDVTAAALRSMAEMSCDESYGLRALRLERRRPRAQAGQFSG